MNVHLQRQRLAAPCFAMLVALCLLLLGVAAAAPVGVGTRAALLIVVAILFATLFELDHLTLLVTPTEVRSGFRLCKSRTPIREITGATVIDVPFWKYGIGIHPLRDGAVVFAARPGRGVRIERRGRLALVVTCHDPAAAVAAILAARDATAAPDQVKAGASA